MCSAHSSYSCSSADSECASLCHDRAWGGQKLQPGPAGTTPHLVGASATSEREHFGEKKQCCLRMCIFASYQKNHTSSTSRPFVLRASFTFMTRPGLQPATFSHPDGCRGASKCKWTLHSSPPFFMIRTAPRRKRQMDIYKLLPRLFWVREWNIHRSFGIDGHNECA